MVSKFRFPSRRRREEAETREGAKIGDLYRRWKARLGTPKAITAMAHT